VRAVRLRAGARSLAAAGVAVATLFIVAPPSQAAAPAQNGGHSLQLQEVNSGDPNNVQVVYRYDGPSADAGGAKLTENGKTVTPTPFPSLDAARRTTGLVVVMDTSASTDVSGTLSEGRNAVKALLPKLHSNTQIAVVSAGSDALLAQGFTADQSLVTKALDGLTPQGDGAIWEGVTRAASEIKNRPEMIGNILLITDGNSAQGVSYASAKGEVLDAGATVYGFGVGDKVGGDPADLAQVTGGVFTTSQKASETDVAR